VNALDTTRVDIAYPLDHLIIHTYRPRSRYLSFPKRKETKGKETGPTPHWILREHSHF